MKRKVLSLMLIALLVLTAIGAAACTGGGTTTPTEPPKAADPTKAPDTEATEPPAEEDPPDAPEEPVTSTPRNETLYINGLNWGAPTNFNPISGNASFGPGDATHQILYMNLFGWDMLTGTLKPLTGKSYEWEDDHTLVVKIFPEAKWNDGTPLTAEDVAYTYNFGNKYSVSFSSYWLYLESVEATDAETVVFKLKEDPFNPLMALQAIRMVSLMPKHVWEVYEQESGESIEEMRQIFNENPIANGPYKLMYYDETKITYVRDDNWWGVANTELSDGKLPAPKYITHPIFASNDIGDLALQAGEIDVSQQFTASVWTMWADGSPIKCYLPDIPYYISGSMPSIVFNMKVPGLDNVDVRRAIAYSIDYDKISEVAMSGYSKDIKPSLLLLNVEAEAKYTDAAKNDDLRWSYNVDKANEILDSINAEKGADGIRVLPDGTRLGPWKLCCPSGWTDWNASLEIVALSASKIGIELVTDFPEAPVYTNGNQMGDFEIAMTTYEGGTSPANPWVRARSTFSSAGVPDYGQQAFYNYGRFQNDRVDELIAAIPGEKDEAKLVEMYTELDRLYLENIPSIPLMYRPGVFYTVNESVWTGMPEQGDGSGVGPDLLIRDWGFRGLFLIEAK